MNKIITEKNYPITLLWIFKTPLIFILLNIVALFFGYYFPELVLAVPILLIINPFIRKSFHYSLNNKYFNIKQGIISKKDRHLPYGVIQNILVKQDLFDRIFGLASLKVENAANLGSKEKKGFWTKARGFKSGTGFKKRKYQETVGSSDNIINIPGLKRGDAEALKALLLQKIKENPVEDTQSGL